MVLVDGAQSVPHLKTDVKEMGGDFLAFSAHKMLGPTGVGVLWARHDVLDDMDPFMGRRRDDQHRLRRENDLGGPSAANSKPARPTSPTWPPSRAALDYLDRSAWTRSARTRRSCVGYALETPLEPFPTSRSTARRTRRSRAARISFNHKVVHSHDVGTILGEEGVVGSRRPSLRPAAHEGPQGFLHGARQLLYLQHPRRRRRARPGARPRQPGLRT